MRQLVTIAIIGITVVMICSVQPAAAQNANICEQVIEIPKIECQALVALYNSTDGDNWKEKSGWLTTNTPCKWDGVRCEKRRVIALSLSNNGLNGSIPPELGYLSILVSLDLSSNHLSGSVQAVLGTLTALTHLDLSNNQFNGVFPFTLKKLTGLEYLDLSGNQLSGLIFAELSTLIKLKHLNLSGNRLRGRVPPDLSKLSGLEYLNLSGNQLCKPLDSSFQTWANNLEYVEDTYLPCPGDLYKLYITWLPVFVVILIGSPFISGVMMGTYGSLKQIYGTSYDYLFGYSKDENKAIRMTGFFNRTILTGGLFSILGGVCGLVAIGYGKAGSTFVFWGVLIGLVVGIGYSLKERIWKTRASTITAGILVGMTAGALFALLLGETTGGMASKIAAVITGMGVGGIAGAFSGFGSKMTRWFPRGVVGGIAGGISGYVAYRLLSQLSAFPLARNSSLAAGIATGIAGVLSGIMIGYVIGLVIGLIAGVLTKIMEFIIRIVNKIVSSVLIPSLIVSRFKTIICGACLRYTEPLKSRYEDGLRYCEHCRKEVEFTHDPGIVRLTFGICSPPISEGRVFALSNPDFEHKEHSIDLSEVYIDPKTCDLRLFERFITYIINHPPKHGLHSVRIFYRGELDDLGQNLKNTLQNNFEYVKGLH